MAAPFKRPTGQNTFLVSVTAAANGALSPRAARSLCAFTVTDTNCSVCFHNPDQSQKQALLSLDLDVTQEG